MFYIFLICTSAKPCSSSQCFLALSTVRVTWRRIVGSSTVRSVSVSEANITTSMTWARICIITRSLRCSETGLSETISRSVRFHYICICHSLYLINTSSVSYEMPPFNPVVCIYLTLLSDMMELQLDQLFVA